MESHTIEQPETVYFNPFEFEDKSFYALYFNIAQHNVKQVFEKICEIVLVKKHTIKEEKLHLKKNNPVLNLLFSQNEEEKQQFIIALLERWMPYAVEGLSDPKLIAERLIHYTERLNSYRNYYTHYHQDEGVPNTIQYREEQFDYDSFCQLKGTKRAIKKLNTIYGLHLFDPNHSTNTEESLLLIQDDDIKRLENRLDFYKKRNKLMNQYDVLFFISLFLQKDEINTVLNYTEGLKDTSDVYYQLNRAYFKMYAVKLPQLKIHNRNVKTGLALAILNELNKCPAIVYQSLSKEDQQKLLITENTFEKKDEKSGELKEYPRTIKLKRNPNRDRFAFFVLQYLELTKKGKELKFHINLGEKFVKEIYTKIIFDQQRERELTSPILTFGHLDAYLNSNHYKEYRESEAEFNQYRYPLKNYKPHYHIINNKIGLRLNQTKSYIPNLEKKQKSEEEKADYFLSIHDLPELVLLNNSRKDKAKYTIGAQKRHFEKFIEDFLKEKLTVKNEDALKKKLETYGLKLNHLPKKIKELLLNKSKNLQQQLNDKIVKEQKISDFLLQAMDEAPENRKNIKNYFSFSFKKGDIATWIARDIVRLLPVREYSVNGKTHYMKLNSSEFQMLQSKLAYFAPNKNQFEALYKELRLEAHPFLFGVSLQDVVLKNKTKAPIGIKKYFKRYLEQRKKWFEGEYKKVAEKSLTLKNCQQTFYYLPLNFNDYFNKKERVKASKAYLLKPLNLPRGVFKNDLMKEMPYKNYDSLSHYLSACRDSEKQWFYKASLENNEFDVKALYKRDKKIRYEWLKDWVLWQMLIQLAPDSEIRGIFENQSLADYLEPSKEGFILNRKLLITLEVEAKNKKKYIIESTRKIRDYGAVRRYLKDKRLPDFLSYLDHTKCYQLDDISDAFNLYEQKRLPIIKTLLAFEKKCFDKDYNSFQKLQDGKPYVEFKRLLFKDEKKTIPENLYINETQLNLQKREQIVKIRNAVLHNQCFYFNEIIENDLYKKLEPKALMEALFNKAETYIALLNKNEVH